MITKTIVVMGPQLEYCRLREKRKRQMSKEILDEAGARMNFSLNQNLI